MTKILKAIYTDENLGPYLGFKGGTAALLFHGLPRFSVDLDFDLLDETKEIEVFERLKVLLDTYGTVKKADNKKFNLFYILSYNNKIENAYNVKVEINKRNFGSEYEIKHLLGIPMRVMVPEDMAAHKMVAMVERIGKTNRDIFDVWYFLTKDWPINKEIIKQRTGLRYKEFLEKAIAALDNKMIDRNILSGLGELLTDKQKVWVKSKLKDEVLFLLRLALSNEEKRN